MSPTMIQIYVRSSSSDGQGDKEGAGTSEFDISRLVDSFTTAAKVTKYAKEHPRITDNSLSLSATGPKLAGVSPVSAPGAH